jgi:hypothetical protein
MIVYRNRASVEFAPEELATRAREAGLIADASPAVDRSLPGWATVKHWRDRPMHPVFQEHIELRSRMRRLERTECVSLHVTFAPDGTAAARIRWRGVGVVFCLMAFVVMGAMLFWGRSWGCVTSLLPFGMLFSGGYFVGRYRLLKHCLAEYRRLKTFWRGACKGWKGPDLADELSAWAVRPLPDPARWAKVVFEDQRRLSLSLEDVEPQAKRAGCRAEFWPDREEGSLWIVMQLTQGMHPRTDAYARGASSRHDMVSLEVTPQPEGHVTAKIRLTGRLWLAIVSFFPCPFIGMLVFGLVQNWLGEEEFSLAGSIICGSFLILMSGMQVWALRSRKRLREACRVEIGRLRGFWESLD